MKSSKKKGRAMIPSSALPFLCVPTDGARKERHNDEVMFILSLLKKSGIREYNLHHVADTGLNYDIPIAAGKKLYDIGYQSADNEIFLIEVMRVGKKRGK